MTALVGGAYRATSPLLLLLTLLFAVLLLAPASADVVSAEAEEEAEHREEHEQQEISVVVVEDDATTTTTTTTTDRRRRDDQGNYAADLLAAMRWKQQLMSSSSNAGVFDDGVEEARELQGGSGGSGDPFEFCPDQVDNAQECYTRHGGANARQCRICIDAYFTRRNDTGVNTVVIPDEAYTCADVESGRLCSVARDCEACGVCYDETADLLACAGRCQSFNCGAYRPPPPTRAPTTTPPPTPAPTIAVSCEDVKSTMDQCFAIDTRADFDRCGTCIFGYFPDEGIGCIGARSVCQLLDSCNACGSCTETFFNFVTCGLGCPRVDCDATPAPANVPTPAPKPVNTYPPTLSPRPTIQVVTAPSAVADRCPAELAALDENCPTCQTCVESHWPDPVKTCDDIEGDTCTGINNCGCGMCGGDVLNLVKCKTGCDFTCPGVAPTPVGSVPAAAPPPTAAPTTTPRPTFTPMPVVTAPPLAPGETAAPSPAPSPAPQPPLPAGAGGGGGGACDDDLQAFSKCAGFLETEADCEKCVDEYRPRGTVADCVKLVDDTCSGVAKCVEPCGTECSGRFVDYVACVTSCTPIKCGSIGGGGDDGDGDGGENGEDNTPKSVSAEAMTLCRNAENSYEDCLTREPDSEQADQCSECVKTNVVDGMLSNDCDFVNNELCGALESCNCGACSGGIEVWLDCLVKNSPDLPQGCNAIDCSSKSISSAVSLKLYSSLVAIAIVSSFLVMTAVAI